SEDFYESSSSESSDGTSGTPGVVALKGCFPLAEADIRGADSAVVVEGRYTSSESSNGTSRTPGLEPVPSPVPEPLCCFPLAEADSHGVDSAVVIGVLEDGVVEEAESPFFFLALAFGLGAASPIAHA
nr:hypothetical protein [Tanacetum cinerariifolium]